MQFQKKTNLNAFRPTGEKEEVNEIPKESLELEFIYGCSKKNTKDDILKVNKNGKFIYPAAACGVVYDPKNHTQKIFRKHKDDCTCIDIHPDELTIATGELGKNDCVFIWDSETLEVIEELDTSVHYKNGGVICLAFSPTGKYLATIGGMENDSILLIWDWKNKKVVGKTNALKTFCYFIEYVDEETIVVGGKNAQKFFSIKGSEITSKNAILGSIGTQQTMYSCFVDKKEGRCLVGTKDGHIYEFKGNHLQNKYKKSETAIYDIEDTDDYFFISGKGGSLIKCDKNFKTIESIKLPAKIRSMANLGDDKMYCMLINGDFVEVDIQDNGKHVVKTLMKGHSGENLEELWALADYEGTDIFVSGSDDGKVMFWDKSKRKCIAVTQFKAKIRAVQIDEKKKHCICGALNGSVYVLDISKVKEGKVELIHDIEISKKEISCIDITDDGKYLVFGSHDDTIYLYENYKLHKSYKGHSSFIQALDLSKNGKYIRSIDGAYETLIWSTENHCRIMDESKFGDIQWKSETLKLNWGVRGIWDMKKYNDGSDINTVDVSFQKKLVVSGDDNARVNLFKYPCCHKNVGKCHSYVGHCSHVCKAIFTKCGNYLLTAGGGDECVFQWKIKN